MEQAGLIAVSVGQLCIINHENGPRTKWLLYLEGSCERKGPTFEIKASGNCGNVGSVCLWASRLNVFAALAFHGSEIEGAGICGGLAFVKIAKSMKLGEGSVVVSGAGDPR